MKNTYVEQYEKNQDHDDFSGIAKDVIAFAKTNDIPIDESPSRVQHMVQTDLSKVLPPQIFALIGRVSSAVEELCKENKGGGK